jgi:Domain of unknown function (DUF4136)
MRSKILPTIIAGVVVWTAVACSSGGGVKVTTALAPDASLTGLHTFSVLAAPERSPSAPALPASDPMLNNSITAQHLRNDLVRGLEGKGYTLAPSNPDFQVAYYEGTKQKLDTTYWNPGPSWRYGYRGYGFRRNRYAWAWPYYSSYGPGFSGYGPGMQVQDYNQGTVIVDVIDPTTQELLWRGQGVSSVSTDPATYAKELGQAVSAILQKFPQAGT